MRLVALACFVWLPQQMLATKGIQLEPEGSLVSQYECGASDLAPSPWGHIRIEGGLEWFEFFSSTFSPKFPCGAYDIVLADPANGCGPLVNDVQGKFVATWRGVCPFVDKVENIANAGGVAAIVVNTSPGLLAMPSTTDSPAHEGKRAHELIPSVMVRTRSGLVIEHSFRVGNPVRGSIVGEIQKRMLMAEAITPCGSCVGEPVTGEIKLVTGGVVKLGDGRKGAFEFFSPDFGAPIPLNVRKRLLMAYPQDACSGLVGDGFKDSIVLVRRGKCAFTEKLEAAYRAGVSMVLFINSDSAAMSLPGCTVGQLHPTHAEFSNGTLVPSGIVFHEAGNRLEDMVSSGNEIFVELEQTDADITDLETLEEMNDMDNWSPDSEKRKEQLENILPKQRSISGEREAEARRLYALAEIHYSV